MSEYPALSEYAALSEDPAVVGLPIALAGIGPHFSFSTRGSAAALLRPWRSITGLFDGSGTLDDHYRRVQATLGEMSGRSIDLRVAASTGHLGLVSRLLCPAMGAAALGFHLDLADAWWQPVSSGPPALCLPDGAARTGCGAVMPTALISALTDATATFSVSYRVLEGNIASAINGAAAALDRARPDLTARTSSIARQLLPDAGPAFRRRSCCLIYRIAPAGTRTYCGDCILRTDSPAAATRC